MVENVPMTTGREVLVTSSTTTLPLPPTTVAALPTIAREPESVAVPKVPLYAVWLSTVGVVPPTFTR